MPDTTHEAPVTMESEMNELTSKTVKAVERFFPWGDMEEDETGYWVRYDDFIQGCADAREAAEAERDALAEKLARAVEALEIVSNYRKKCHDYDDDIGHDLRTFEEEDIERIEALARTILAELKGQNDE